MTDQREALREDAVLEVLTNEGWVADPDATDYNLRVVASVVRAALAAEPPALPEGTRLVLMSEELALVLGADRVEWGQPDANGWYAPTLYKADAAEPPALAVEVALSIVYAQGYEVPAPVAVAVACDEVLDTSGAMLGRIRERARLAREASDD